MTDTIYGQSLMRILVTDPSEKAFLPQLLFEVTNRVSYNLTLNSVQFQQ